MAVNELSRRQFLARAGTLVVGFSLAPALAQVLTPSAGASAATAPADLKVDAWLTIGPANTVTIYSGRVELGTGVQTALTQIVIEELSLNLGQVVYFQGDTVLTPMDQGVTAGSKTIQTQGPRLRIAAATAFQTLLALASQRIGVPTQALHARDGKIGIGANLNRGLTYAELIGDQQIMLTNQAPSPNAPPNPNYVNPANVIVKNPRDYTVVGQSVARVELPEKILGTFTFIQDVKIDGMTHGRVIRLGGRNATFLSFDATSLATTQALPGVIEVVQQGNFVGVVAATEYAAIVAARTLKVNWDFGPPLIPQESLPQALADPANIYRSNNEVDHGDVDTALAGASAKLEATYFTPYQMHGAMGSSVAVADVRSGQATVWSSTQGVFPLRGALAQVLQLPPTNIHVIYVESSGCYGHNGADDVSADAALLSKLARRPVRVAWTRQDEHGWEPLGPAMLHKMRGGLDANGGLVAWEHSVFTTTHSTRPGNNGGNLLAGQAALGLLPSTLGAAPTNNGTRNAPVTYVFPNNRLVANHVRMFNGTVVQTGTPQQIGSFRPSQPLTYTLPRPSALRSLGGFSNSFANESFLDELAVRGKQDPLDFRLRYTTDPRAAAVLEAVGKKADWKKKLPAAPSGWRRGRGLGYLRYEVENAYAATYAEVLVETATGVVRVVRVVVAHDCGQIVNPDGLIHQIEGNVIQGISRTFKEEVTYNSKGVTSLIWAPNPFAPTVGFYRVLDFTEVPPIECVLLDHPEEPSWGAGEPTIGTLPGAIGNAIFNATGARLRTLPMTPARVLAAIAAL
jgi:nicotinate dehydrogenase subunit B